MLVRVVTCSTNMDVLGFQIAVATRAETIVDGSYAYAYVSNFTVKEMAIYSRGTIP